ncbi:hypothetical protein FJY94_01755 [Candidatus Kaiserbacteria bacterium]|nr:hypothetical protein [Candidatus Kaiserbacteria bacterium]
MGLFRSGRFQRLGSGEPLDIMRPDEESTETPRLSRSPLPIALLGVIAVVGIGLLIVDARSLSRPGESSGSLVGLGTIIDTSPADPNTRAVRRIDLEQSIFTEVQQNAPFVYLPPAGGPAQTVATPTKGAPEIDDILAALTPKARETWQVDVEPIGTPSWAQAYSFIPTGLVSTTSRPSTRTEIQQRLYDYGNSLGSHVLSFEATHRNASQIAADQLADRGNPVKNTALKSLGDDYAALGKRILTMDDVPEQAAAAHKKLGDSYVALGGSLRLLADAQSDQQLLDAVNAYNKTVDVQIPAYVAMVTLFTTHSVSFSPDDPGSAFRFSPTQ